MFGVLKVNLHLTFAPGARFGSQAVAEFEISTVTLPALLITSTVPVMSALRGPMTSGPEY
jgi:hypothetical protein